MAAVGQQLGHSTGTVDEVMTQYDADNNGVLDFDEFIHLLCQVLCNTTSLIGFNCWLQL